MKRKNVLTPLRSQEPLLSFLKGHDRDEMCPRQEGVPELLAGVMVSFSCLSFFSSNILPNNKSKFKQLPWLLYRDKQRNKGTLLTKSEVRNFTWLNRVWARPFSSSFLIEFDLDWVKYNGVMLTFFGQDTLKSVR